MVKERPGAMHAGAQDTLRGSAQAGKEVKEREPRLAWRVYWRQQQPPRLNGVGRRLTFSKRPRPVKPCGWRWIAARTTTLLGEAQRR